ncbi:MAG: efflux RND transporter periplasmic adaptor subunit [Oculatellaceae cyanobacterium Prado106]|jgi:HlyD family secretion protein|nr:efflux RND transporter periplasmic adaptor subunit [Oculatellaceae cyanobacterium Prado106]
MQLPIGKVRNPTPWLIGLISAGILGVGGVTYWTIQNSARVPDIAEMTVPVEAQPLQVRITASGTVQPIQSVNISPKNAGIVAELFVEQGDRVRQGQIMARMENQEIEAQLLQARARVAQAEARLAEVQSGSRPEEISQARARIAQAEAQVEQARSRLNLASQRVDRNQQLADEGAISRDQLDEIISTGGTAQADLDQALATLRERQENLRQLQNGSRPEDIADAEAQVAEAIGGLRATEVQQQDTLIRAPFDGIVTQKFATEGAFVTPTTSASEATSATSTAIVAVAQGLEVLAEVPEVDIQQLKIGQAVEVAADAFPGQTFNGNVKLIAPEAVVRQNVTSFQVRVALTTGQNQLRSGMNVDVVFLGNEVPSALVVPTVSIVTKGGRTGVLVPDARNKPEFRPVKIGLAVDDNTQVLEGLESGDRVFTDIPPGSEWDPAQQQEEAENNQSRS